MWPISGIYQTLPFERAPVQCLKMAYRRFPIPADSGDPSTLDSTQRPKTMCSGLITVSACLPCQRFFLAIR